MIPKWDECLQESYQAALECRPFNLMKVSQKEFEGIEQALGLGAPERWRNFPTLCGVPLIVKDE